jgi:hypothetical protein
MAGGSSCGVLADEPGPALPEPPLSERLEVSPSLNVGVPDDDVPATPLADGVRERL